MGPDAEDDVNAEEHEEYGVRERAVLDCRVVHAHVPGRQCSSASANCLPVLSLSLLAGNPAIASGSRPPPAQSTLQLWQVTSTGVR